MHIALGNRPACAYLYAVRVNRVNLQDFSFTCLLSFLMPLAFAYVVAMVMVWVW